MLKKYKTNLRRFFFENLGLKQTIFKNTFWLTLAEGIARFSKLILIVYVARILGVADYGKFTFALAFVALFTIFSDAGLPPITIREFSQGKKEDYPAIFSLKLLLNFGALLLILIGSFLVTPDPLIRKAIWILGIYIMISNFTDIVYVFFKALQKMQYEAWGRISQALAMTGAGFLVIFNFPSVKNLSYAYLFAALVALIFVLSFMHFKIYRLELSWKAVVWKKFLSMSWPLALNRLISTTCFYFPTIMMGYLGQINQVGWYNASLKITNVTLLPMLLISQSFYPALSNFFKISEEKFQKSWNFQIKIMIFFAVPLMVGGVALAPKIINFVYGSAFSPSVFAFQILIIAAGINFLSGPLGQLLVIFNQQKRILWVTFLITIIAIILYLIFIPKFGFYGASAVTTITSFLFLGLFSGIIFRFTATSVKILNLEIFLSFIKVAISSFLMYFIISRSPVYHLNIVLTVLIGAIIYLVSFFLIQKMTAHFYD